MNETGKPLDEKVYVAMGGGVCPLCRSCRVEEGVFMPDSLEPAMLLMCCADCGACWVETYTLLGYRGLLYPHTVDEGDEESEPPEDPFWEPGEPDGP